MPTKQLMQHCNHCGRPTLHIQQTPNHLLHLVLTILTAGIWLIVWIFTKPTRPTCTVCGNTKSFFNADTKLGLVIIVAVILFVVIKIQVAKTTSNRPPVSAIQKHLNEFLVEPDSVLLRINNAINSKDWDKAITITEYYLPTNHPEIKRLSALAIQERSKAVKNGTMLTSLSSSNSSMPSAKQKYLDEFLKNPDDALGRLKSAINNEEWNKALTIAEYYLPTKHPEIVKLHAAVTNRKKYATSSNAKPLKQPQPKKPEESQPKPAAKHNSTPAGNYIVQVASTTSLAGANLIANRLKELAYTPKVRTITTNNFTTYRIFTEPFNDKDDAMEAKNQIDKIMKINSLVLPIKND